MKKTTQLKLLLENYKNQLSSEEYESLVSETDRLISHYSDHFKAIPLSQDRARETHMLINREIDKASDIPVSCRKGCGACCHLEIEITKDEASLLADSLIELNLQIDETKLQEQANRQRLDPLWERRIHPENACVFLDAEMACTNYENRPMVCRKHSVVSPAEECMREGGQPVPRMIPLAEIIISASISLEENEFGSLSKMLGKELQRRRLALGEEEMPHRSVIAP